MLRIVVLFCMVYHLLSVVLNDSVIKLYAHIVILSIGEMSKWTRNKRDYIKQEKKLA